MGSLHGQGDEDGGGYVRRIRREEKYKQTLLQADSYLRDLSIPSSLFFRGMVGWLLMATINDHQTKKGILKLGTAKQRSESDAPENASWLMAPWSREPVEVSRAEEEPGASCQANKIWNSETKGVDESSLRYT